MRPSYPVARLDYTLPPELIAQQPLPERTASRLLHVRVADGRIADRCFADLLELLPPETLIVLNDSRVIPARIYGTRPVDTLGQGGGRVEVLYHRWLGDGVCEAVIGSGSPLGAEERVLLPGGWHCELLEPKRLDGIRVRYLKSDGHTAALDELLAYFNAHGLPPTPPYIKRPATSREADEQQAKSDMRHYQTVYATEDGSVAAPTAGMHFDQALLAQLQANGHAVANVTLHVGLGTFAPVRVADLRDHEMHEELYRVSGDVAAAYAMQRNAARPVLAVGTTSLRVLHTLCSGTGLRACPEKMSSTGGNGHGDPSHHLNHHFPSTGNQSSPKVITGATRAFIYPGHGTDACEMLLTNFHLPRSTLLALVYAFGGEELMRRVYAHAIEQRYRFYSYGDCMLIDRRGAG